MTNFVFYDLDDQSSNSRSSISDEEVILASNNPKKPAGRKKFRETRHPIYRGVRRRNSGNRVCEMREPNKKSRIWLGTYPTVEMAARAHDVAAIALRGRLACLNFADSSWRLPIPASGEIKDIQKAAAQAAESFRPSKKVDQVVPVIEVDDKLGSSEDVNSEEQWFLPQENVFCMDEDEIFGMPWFIPSLAEGLILPPPPIQSIDEEVQEHHLGLWSFDIMILTLFTRIISAFTCLVIAQISKLRLTAQ